MGWCPRSGASLTSSKRLKAVDATASWLCTNTRDAPCLPTRLGHLSSVMTFSLLKISRNWVTGRQTLLQGRFVYSKGFVRASVYKVKEGRPESQSFAGFPGRALLLGVEELYLPGILTNHHPPVLEYCCVHPHPIGLWDLGGIAHWRSSGLQNRKSRV